MRKILISLGVILSVNSVVQANDLTIYVAPRDSEASKNAQAFSDGKLSVTERKIHRAFDRASEHLKQCGQCTVSVKVAGGEYIGKARTGQWAFPDTFAPKSSLKILGGYTADFKQRQPFKHPSVLIVPKPRSGTVLRFEGRKHGFNELVLSGFAIDVAPGNNYDVKTNSLTKGGSSSWPLISFGYMNINRLVIADNVFMNAANGVGAPAVKGMTANAEVVVRNNLFLNNVHNWVVTSANKELGRYVIEHNSFIMNWPYNPDTGTSNPGALEIGNRYTAKLVDIKHNLFAYNPGGAIHPQWDDKQGPPIAFTNNTFFRNGSMFEGSKDREAMVVGKFNGGAQHALYDPIDVEDEFSWKSQGNHVADPSVVVPVMKLTAIGDQAAVQEQAPTEPLATEVSTEEADVLAILDEEFESELSLDEFSLDDDFAIDELAEDGVIKNYAPMMPFNRQALPLSRVAGASSELIYKD
ncbi:MAG: hypothetical protein ACRBEE_13855 [Arenicella sp.]